MISITSLKKRADFLALRRAPATSMAGFKLVRSKRTIDDGGATVRVGYTVTKKIGNAVRRNRIRRRLKSAVEAVFPLQAEANADYIVIARHAAFDMPFSSLVADMEKAVIALKSGKVKRHSNRHR